MICQRCSAIYFWAIYQKNGLNCSAKFLGTFISFSSFNSKPEKPVRSTRLISNLIEENHISVEKYSLSRGLALNRFEKDFMIYPEYADSDDVKSISLLAGSLRSDIKAAGKSGSNNNVSTCLSTIIRSNRIASFYVPSEFGGSGMCNKDLIIISEALGEDLSMFLKMDQVHRAANILTLFGSEDQKTKYLTGIASGYYQPALCFYEGDTGFDFESMKTQSFAVHGSPEKLNGIKMNVIGALSANLFLVLAHRKSVNSPQNLTCFIFEKKAFPDCGIAVINVLNTMGLASIDVSSVEFRDVLVEPINILDSVGTGYDIVNEIFASNKTTYGGVAVGLMKKIINNVAEFCNSTVQYNALLSENIGIQKTVTEMALKTFALESMSYYVGGLLDENLVILSDIENAIIHRFANETVREAIAGVLKIVGLHGCDKGLAYEKMLRDILTMMSLYSSDDNLVEQISVGTLTTWSNIHANSLGRWHSGLSGAMNRLLSSSTTCVNFNSPKLIHYIAEHAHPSLENSCRDLEFTMTRLNILLQKIVSERGKQLAKDFAALSSIASVIEGNLIMISTISRASRSYSIGLRNADLELSWTLMLCSRIALQSKTELISLADYFDLVRFNPTVLEIGRTVLNVGGYCLESPVEKNW